MTDRTLLGKRGVGTARRERKAAMIVAFVIYWKRPCDKKGTKTSSFLKKERDRFNLRSGRGDSPYGKLNNVERLGLSPLGVSKKDRQRERE